MSTKVKVRFRITFEQIVNLPSKVRGYLVHTTWKRGARPDNSGVTTSKTSTKEGSIDIGDETVLESTILKNYKNQKLEAKGLSLVVVAEKVKGKSDKVVGKVIVNLSEFVYEGVTKKSFLLVSKLKKYKNVSSAPAILLSIEPTILDAGKQSKKERRLASQSSGSLGGDGGIESSEISFTVEEEESQASDYLSMSESIMEEPGFKTNPSSSQGDSIDPPVRKASRSRLKKQSSKRSLTSADEEPEEEGEKTKKKSKSLSRAISKKKKGHKEKRSSLIITTEKSKKERRSSRADSNLSPVLERNATSSTKSPLDDEDEDALTGNPFATSELEESDGADSGGDIGNPFASPRDSDSNQSENPFNDAASQTPPADVGNPFATPREGPMITVDDSKDQGKSSSSTTTAKSTKKKSPRKLKHHSSSTSSNPPSPSTSSYPLTAVSAASSSSTTTSNASSTPASRGNEVELNVAQIREELETIRKQSTTPPVAVKSLSEEATRKIQSDNSRLSMVAEKQTLAIKILNEKYESAEAERLRLLDALESESRAAEAQKDLNARNIASLKKQVRDLGLEVESYKIAAEKVQRTSPKKSKRAGSGKESERDTVMRNVSMIRQEQELSTLQSQVTFSRELLVMREKIVNLVSSPSWELDEEGRNISALHFAKYLTKGCDALHPERQFDDLNEQFLNEVTQSLLRSYSNFVSDFSYLVAWLNWIITLLEAAPSEYRTSIAFNLNHVNDDDDGSSSVSPESVSFVFKTTREALQFCEQFRENPASVDAGIQQTPSRRFFSELDKLAGHVFALIASLLYDQAEALQISVLFVEAPAADVHPTAISKPKRGTANEAGFARFSRFLTETLTTLNARLPSAVTSKIMAQMFYSINCLVFNHIMTMPHLTATNAYSMKMGVSKIEEWASKSSQTKSFGPLARDQFDSLVCVANALVIDKSIFSGDFDFAPIFPQINFRQLEYIFSRFLADEYAPKPVSSITINKIRRNVTDDMELTLDHQKFV